MLPLRYSLLAVSLVLCGMSCAFTPRDALSYKSQEYAAAQAKLSAQRGYAHALDMGLSSTANINRRDEGEEYALGFSWRRPIVPITQAKQAEDTAKRELTRLLRESGKQALLAHADLWEAQMTEKAAAIRAEAAVLSCTEAERKQGLGAIPALDAETARIDQADAKLLQRKAKLLLTAALDETARLGLTGDADSSTLHFRIPAAKIDDFPSYQDAKWNVLVAGAQVKQSHRDNAVGFGVNALYQKMESTIEANLSTRGPNADVTAHRQPLTVQLPAQYSQFALTPGWQFIFKLELPFDPANRSQMQVATAELNVAKARLQEQEKTLPIQLAKARAAVDAAVETMELSRERYELDARRVTSTLTRADAGAVSKLVVLDAQATQSEHAAAYARAWKDYVTAVNSYLELAGGSWEVEP